MPLRKESDSDKDSNHFASSFRKKNDVKFEPSIANEIVSTKPGFLVRFGNAFFFVILIFVLITCWFIEYPEIILAPAKLASVNTPKPVTVLVEGKLTKLLISDKNIVTKGQILGYIESTANHDQVFDLQLKLDSIHKLLNANKSEAILKYFKHSYGQLGELQVHYENFHQIFFSFRSYMVNGFYIKKKAILERDKVNSLTMHRRLLDRRLLLEKDLFLAEKNFKANDVLKNDSVISEFDYRTEQSKLIEKELTIPEIDIAILENERQQNEKQIAIAELEFSIDQQKSLFTQSLNTLQNQIEEWIRTYSLVAPINGEVAFSSFIQENQQLELKQTAFFIIPENSSYYAETEIPQFNFGKIAVGQRVLLKLPSYPFQEYGCLIGEVVIINTIPTENGYLAKIRLVNGLTTNNNKQIEYRDGLIASAEIITKDLKLLERFYYNIIKKIK